MNTAIMVQRQTDEQGVITLPEQTVVAIGAKSLRSAIGSVDYYLLRYADFMSRADPDEQAPDYYLGYGDYYVRNFHTVVRPELSPAGQAWVDKTLVLLQRYMEDRRDANPFAFADLEHNGEDFRAFAYGTHSQAYINAGVCDLPINDLRIILFTPRLFDLLTLGGVEEMTDVLIMCLGIWGSPEGMAPWGPP
ncbi:hypothetical protein FK531_14260 [Rhodococcus spelaei]|uniref:Uncharacterized protein n=1 Tax=Rhodococcus spelaei TaxID=2546320 RepID=A0A541B7G1_9NOCA|nr:hypothetical protein [Rhodococcus spelaei]TQF68267.1 hypothetical protein FK531_14260 [Rhodococcus spelaei]